MNKMNIIICIYVCVLWFFLAFPNENSTEMFLQHECWCDGYSQYTEDWRHNLQHSLCGGHGKSSLSLSLSQASAGLSTTVHNRVVEPLSDVSSAVSCSTSAPQLYLWDGAYKLIPCC